MQHQLYATVTFSVLAKLYLRGLLGLETKVVPHFSLDFVDLGPPLHGQSVTHPFS
jgi:hypothetical protein